MLVTPDNRFLQIWNNVEPALSTYEINTDTWTAVKAINTNTTSLVNKPGFVALMDPTSTGTGTIYVPYGCQLTCVYNTITQTLKTTVTPFVVPTVDGGGLVGYTFVFSTLRQTMLFYGGYTSGTYAPSPNQDLWEYLPLQDTWSQLKPQGTGPGDINGHCFVETSDHTKMLVFGGSAATRSQDQNVTFSSSLYILNVQDLTWTRGADAPASQARKGHACATNGESLVVWGGVYGLGVNQVLMSNVPLIYHIPTNQWVHDFVVSTTATNNTTTSSLGGPIGGAIGGVIILAVIGFFFYRRLLLASWTNAIGVLLASWTNAIAVLLASWANAIGVLLASWTNAIAVLLQLAIPAQ
ncbi:hypothetical protein BGZ96_004440 [Linnemannia gamsii]|uniref:Attractin/MKLN-like beta-propeller domain-containing protein n=1 Tax=Linnemannia gamsii TaxID=64522 RepID=A0ABQ7JI49_9FUNG|nr:hypothetical protein BGZ96_004440 [Linnemannia gamsii]